MNDSYVSRPLIIAAVLWTATFVLIAAAWTLRLISIDLWHWSALLGLSAGVIAPMAAVVHVKAYLVRVCNLVRNTSGLSEARDFRAVR